MQSFPFIFGEALCHPASQPGLTGGHRARDDLSQSAQCSLCPGAPAPPLRPHQRLPSAPNSALLLCHYSFQGILSLNQSKDVIVDNVKYANICKYFSSCQNTPLYCCAWSLHLEVEDHIALLSLVPAMIMGMLVLKVFMEDSGWVKSITSTEGSSSAEPLTLTPHHMWS